MNQRFQWLMALSSRPWILAFALLLLHLGLLQDVASVVGRGFLIGHLGAVLLWQPLVRQDRELAMRELLVGCATVAALGIWMSWGLVLVWMLVLAGLLGAELFRYPEGRTRLSFWVALGYLILSLVTLVLPQLLPMEARPPELLRQLAVWSGALFILAVPLLAQQGSRTRAQVPVDFVGGLVIVLVLSGVLLGALALMFISSRAYVPALLQSLAMMAASLVLLGWAWSPGQGTGLSLAVARHALSGGMPFSQWLDEVARLAAEVEAPEALVREAVGRMLDWPGVEGADWRVRVEAREHTGFAGRLSLRRARLQYGALEIGIHTRSELPTMLLWQMDLMVRLLAEFHLAREQSRHLQSISYLRAVHETGARMTHEVKNLLQSIDTLCFAMTQAERDGRHAALQEMLARQLPMISQRLHEALERIRRPGAAEVRMGSVLDWWASAQQRLQGHGLLFVWEGDAAGANVPELLFDTVLDNLVRNALDKSPAPGNIRVRLSTGVDGCVLEVEDDGAAIPVARAAELFVRPMPSDRGLGIGLYQASRLAESLDYRLVLTRNTPGSVRFRLAMKEGATSDNGETANPMSV